jgi:molybdopterin/thiamine biosynthesis adenylyltransferase
MGDEVQAELQGLIQARSRSIVDSAGREVNVLGDRQALEIAGKCSRPVHEVYQEALRLGSVPQRYLRNREIISSQEQLKLAESRVAVVGLGGLGGQVILLLARLGVGHLVAVDWDLFDETNLNRQALSSGSSLGKQKSQVAVDVVSSINPGIEVLPYQGRLELSNATEILFGSDVVVDALDSVPDRLILERTTKQLGVPLVHGALAGFEGWVTTIFPDDPGLMRLYGGNQAKGNDLRRPDAILGVPAPAPAIIASLQTMEVIKIILNRGRLFRNLMVYVDLEGGQINEFVI